MAEFLVVAASFLWMWRVFKKARDEANRKDIIPEAPRKTSFPKPLSDLLTSYGIDPANAENVYILHWLTEELFHYLRGLYREGKTRGPEIACILSKGIIGKTSDTLVIIAILRNGEDVAFATKNLPILD